MYFGVVGFSAKYPNACKDTTGYYSERHTFSYLAHLDSPGCYHIFRTEQYGYYCGFYTFGPVRNGEVIGAIFIPGTPIPFNPASIANPTSEEMEDHMSEESASELSSEPSPLYLRGSA
jgi:hypothetical protein